jgi:hypothetical protein
MASQLFVIRHSGLFRHSGFAIRHSEQASRTTQNAPRLTGAEVI